MGPRKGSTLRMEYGTGGCILVEPIWCRLCCFVCADLIFLVGRAGFVCLFVLLVCLRQLLTTDRLLTVCLLLQ